MYEERTGFCGKKMEFMPQMNQKAQKYTMKHFPHGFAFFWYFVFSFLLEIGMVNMNKRKLVVIY